MVHVIAGLGNPDPEYTGTRHSIGRAIVQSLADKNLKAKLVTPDEYMNNSGKAVKALVKTLKDAEKLIVVYDDLDLPLGSLKISFDKSSGGHKGVESVINHLKTQKFIRVRIGICPTIPGGKLKKPAGEEKIVKFLMSQPTPAEQIILKKVAKRAEEAIEMIIEEGWPKASSIYTS
jgi:PTH1 family peptidyl-tRNA hydrolase